MEKLVSEISQAALNIVFPIHCQNCQLKLPFNSNNYLCNRCFDEIKINKPPFCIRCGQAINSFSNEIETLCASCIGNNYFFTQAWQCCEYGGIVKELIHKLKYNKKLFIKQILSDILYNYTTTHINYLSIDGIVAVPMHRPCINKRGFNQSELLAKALSTKLCIEYIGNSLIKNKKTEQQTRLTRSQRLKNLKDAFLVKDKAAIKGKKILLIDDVFTTGATVNECSKALASSGAQSVYALAIARGKL